jgi:hypothetical protein
MPVKKASEEELIEKGYVERHEFIKLVFDELAKKADDFHEMDVSYEYESWPDEHRTDHHYTDLTKRAEFPELNAVLASVGWQDNEIFLVSEDVDVSLGLGEYHKKARYNFKIDKDAETGISVIFSKRRPEPEWISFDMYRRGFKNKKGELKPEWKFKHYVCDTELQRRIYDELKGHCLRDKDYTLYYFDPAKAAPVADMIYEKYLYPKE